MASKKEIEELKRRILSLKENLISEQNNLEKYNSSFGYKIKAIFTFFVVVIGWVGFTSIITVLFKDPQTDLIPFDSENIEGLQTISTSIFGEMFKGSLIGLVFASASWSTGRNNYYSIVGYIKGYKEQIKVCKSELVKIKNKIS